MGLPPALSYGAFSPFLRGACVELTQNHPTHPLHQLHVVPGLFSVSVALAFVSRTIARVSLILIGERALKNVSVQILVF